MDYAALKTEILSGPLATELAPLVKLGADNRIAAALNRPDQRASRLVPADELRAVLFATGVWTALCRAQFELLAGAAVKAAAKTVQDYCAMVELIDLDARAVTGMLDTLESAGLVNTDQRAALLALRYAPASRAETVRLVPCGGGVTADDVSRALEGLRNA